MVLFGGKKKPSYEVIREQEETILRFNAEEWSMVPSIEDTPQCMALVIDKLIQNKGITKISFAQKQDYEYDYPQVQMLIEVAELVSLAERDKDTYSYNALNFDKKCERWVASWFNALQTIIDTMKKDPVGSYVELTRHIRREKIRLDKLQDAEESKYLNKYIDVLEELRHQMERLRIIFLLEDKISGYKDDDRSVYRQLFSPSIKPDFMFTRLMAQYPEHGKEIANYNVGETEVVIFELPDTVQYLYHVTPPEFKLDEDKYEILDTARRILSEHKPEKQEFVDPKRMREVFYNVGKDLLDELARYKRIKMTPKDLDTLAKILVRYTVGFGLIEVLLEDEKMQDISVNSPAGQIPLFIVHADYDDCKTNIFPTKMETESWASKLRLISGRPLDEANPLLDTELELPGASVRVSAITYPLDPTGLAFSFRRHRDRPWTLPLFIKYKTITPLAAGLLSFLVDGTRTMLICGTRSSGKSSLLSAVLIEIMRRHRILTIEDTLELPTNAMRKLGFNVQPMKVAAALSKNTGEMTAEDGIRSTLRLGDSALIVGEVRSGEAKALYEAMRVGAAANVVAGTIHGDSPYGIFDRVVNDIGVPKTSFKATDICIIVNPIKSADGIHKIRRVTQITEVRKDWTNDPNLEGGFLDLMKYDPKTDELKATAELINGETEVIKAVAGNVKEWAGNWDATWQNIMLRAKCKEAQVKIWEQTKDDELLEAEFTILCNDMMHKIVDKVKTETSKVDNDRIFFEWNEWLQREVRKRQMKLDEEKKRTTAK